VSQPRLFVLAGPNGAGKSTVAQKYIIGRLPFINADDIARRMAGGRQDVSRYQLQAGREAIRERERMLSKREDFAFETTLTGNSELRLIERANAAGYKVTMIFVGVGSAALSAARVDLRVSAGGHSIPKTDLMRRYSRSMAGMAKALAMCHRSIVLDNSTSRRRLLCSVKAGVTKHLSRDLPAWADTAIPTSVKLAQRSHRI
jgi:predicted ABC-type ATPase